MEKMNLPAFYTSVCEDDQRTISGGGELSDALGDFWNNSHLTDFFWNSSIITVSFTFVPFLLFNVIKAGYDFVKDVSDSFVSLFNFRDTTVQTLEQTAAKTGK